MEMTEKRYYKRDYEELYYIIDSNTISEEEFDEKIEYDGYTAFEDSLTGKEIVDLLNENERLKKFKKQAYSIINNKINELAMTTSYGDVRNDLRVFAQRVLIDVEKEFDNPTYENCKVNVE